MFAIGLSLILAAAPVPKAGAVYEGQIAVLIRAPEPSVMLLKPNGEEVRRVPIKDTEGYVYSIRQARNASFAIVETSDDNGVSRIYRINLDNKGETKLLRESKDGSAIWCMTSDGAFAYFSESNRENANPNRASYNHWKYDFKTGKAEKFEALRVFWWYKFVQFHRSQPYFSCQFRFSSSQISVMILAWKFQANFSTFTASLAIGQNPISKSMIPAPVSH